MKERLNYIDQLDEQYTPPTKKCQIIEEIKKDNEVITTSTYVYRQEQPKPQWIKIFILYVYCYYAKKTTTYFGSTQMHCISFLKMVYNICKGNSDIFTYCFFIKNTSIVTQTMN